MASRRGKSALDCQQEERTREEEKEGRKCGGERTRRREEKGGGGRAKGKDRSRSSRQARANSKIVMQAPGQAGESREGGTPPLQSPHPPKCEGAVQMPPALFTHLGELS